MARWAERVHNFVDRSDSRRKKTLAQSISHRAMHFRLSCCNKGPISVFCAASKINIYLTISPECSIKSLCLPVIAQLGSFLNFSAAQVA